MDQLTKEALRYLGYGKHAVDNRTLAMVHAAFEKLRGVANEKFICRIICCHICDKTDSGNVLGREQTEEGSLYLGELKITSRNLAKNLKGCDKAILFGATLGTETDTLIRRATVTDMAEAVILQACAAALLEEYCDVCQEKLAVEQEKKGRYLRPRFSPGYGDFSIEYQKEIMEMLDCAKKIGLTMTDGYMMTPTKSVTAVIGLSPTKENCHRKGCEACEKKDCLFRRDTL